MGLHEHHAIVLIPMNGKWARIKEETGRGVLSLERRQLDVRGTGNYLAK